MRQIKNVRSFGQSHEEKEKVHTGPKSLPPTPEEKLAKVDKILAINEAKTAKRLERDSQKIARRQLVDNEGTPSTHPVDSKNTSGIHLKRDVSYYTLLSMPKRLVSRQLLEMIKANAQKRGDTWFSVIDTAEAMALIKKPNFHLKTAMARLKKQGWFEVAEASPGFRRLTIDPLVYGLK